MSTKKHKKEGPVYPFPPETIRMAVTKARDWLAEFPDRHSRRLFYMNPWGHTVHSIAEGAYYFDLFALLHAAVDSSPYGPEGEAKSRAFRKALQPLVPVMEGDDRPRGISDWQDRAPVADIVALLDRYLAQEVSS